MSHFYSTIEGTAKNPAKGRGHQRISSHTRTWEFGVEISGYKTESGETSFQIYRTGGSNNPSEKVLLGTLGEKYFTIPKEKKLLNVQTGETKKVTFQKLITSFV